MVKYRNEQDGRVVELPYEDEWLEASSGWTRIEEPEAKAKDKDERSSD